MKYVKENLKFYVFMVIMCIIGGYFTTIYSLKLIDSSTLEESIKQLGSINVIIAISVVQISLYAAIFAGIGIVLSNKVGLWKKFKQDKKAIYYTIIISIVGGLCLSVVDRYIFGYFIPEVAESYNVKPTLDYMLMAFTYGGVFEEILMRLFIMSLFVWIMQIVFYKKDKKIPDKAFIIANVMSALLFAAGHLPSTIQLFGHLNAAILIRCFLMNGAFGLAFGWLYRKYSIHYSMLAHFGCHLVSKVIWLLFI